MQIVFNDIKINSLPWSKFELFAYFKRLLFKFPKPTR